MRNDTEALKDTRRNNTNHSTRKVWLHETRRKNRRLARTRLSDNHTIKKGLEPLRREGNDSRISASEVTGGLGFIGFLWGLSLQDPEGMLSLSGAVVVGFSIMLFIVSTQLEKKP